MNTKTLIGMMLLSKLKRYLENLSSNKELNTPVTLQEASKGIEIAEQIRKIYPKYILMLNKYEKFRKK